MQWLVYNEVLTTSKPFMRTTSTIDLSWLTDSAPRAFRQQFATRIASVRPLGGGMYAGVFDNFAEDLLAGLDDLDDLGDPIY